MKFLDSSIWIAHLVEANTKAISLLESDTILFSSILTLFEVRKKLIKEGFEIEEIMKILDFIKNRSVIVNLNDEIVNLAAELSLKHDIPSIDSIIYSSSIDVGINLLTFDNDFRGLENVEVLSK